MCPGYFLCQLTDFLTVKKFDIYVGFPWSTTHDVPLHFLYTAQKFDIYMRFSWSVTHDDMLFPILFKDLTFATALLESVDLGILIPF